MARTWHSTLALIVTYALLGLLMNSVGTVILQSIKHYGVSKPHAATLEACKDLSVVAASFLFAVALPRFGFRRAQLCVMAAIGTGALLLPLANSFWATQLFFVLTGLCFGVAKVATYSTIGLLRPDREGHASLTTLLEGTFMIGILIGIWMFGWFIDRDQTGRDWLHVYWVIAGLCAGAAFLWWTAKLDETAVEPGQGTEQASRREMLSLAVLPATISFLVAIFLYVLIEQSIGTWLPTFNNEILHLPPGMSVQAASIFIATLALGRLAASPLVQWLGWLKLLLGCLASMALLVILTLPLTRDVALRADVTWLSAPAAAYLFPMIGVFMAPIYPITCSVMLSSLPRDRHAAMVGLIVIFSALGGTIGSFITGMVFQHLSGQFAFYLVLVPMAATAVALLRFHRVAVVRASA